MVFGYKLEGQRQLQKAVATHFNSHGWTVGNSQDDRFDFSVEYQNVKFHISCIDSAMAKFISMNQIFERMQNLSDHFLSAGSRALVFITNFDPPLGWARSIAILVVDELSILTDIATFEEEPPASLSFQQNIVLRKSPAVCFSVAERFLKSGDSKSAIDWLELVIAGGPASTRAYRYLYDIYRQAENRDMSKAIALTALKVQPEDVFFLSAMADMSAEEQNYEQQMLWKCDVARVREKKARLRAENGNGSKTSVAMQILMGSLDKSAISNGEGLRPSATTMTWRVRLKRLLLPI